MGWSAPSSLEERLIEVAVGLLALLAAATVLLWAAGELAGFLAHRAWPPVTMGDRKSVV